MKNKKDEVQFKKKGGADNGADAPPRGLEGVNDSIPLPQRREAARDREEEKTQDAQK